MENESEQQRQLRFETSPLLVSDEDSNGHDLHDSEPDKQSASFSEVSLLLRIGPGLLLGAFAVTFDLSYLVTNYSGRIASDLHQLHNAVWIVLAGSISGSCFQPLYALCANKYGRRSTILAGSSVTVVGLFLCSISMSIWELSLSRVLVGAGSSGLGLLTTIILNDVVPLTHLALWRSVIMATTTAGLMLGGPLGSQILTMTNWHIPFVMEGVLLLLAIGFLYATLRLPPSTPEPSPNTHHPLGLGKKHLDFDILGACVMILLLATPLLALNMGGGVLPWGHPAIISLLSVTPILLAALLYIEGFLAQSPIFPIRFFTSVPVLLVNLCAIVAAFSWNQIMFNLSFYTQIRDLDGNSFQDWILTCVFVGQPLGSFFTGLCIRKTRSVKAVLAGSICLSCFLYTGLGVGWIKPEIPAFAPVLLLLGFGIGASESCLTVALFSTVAKKDQAALYALLDLVVSFSRDIGITVSSSMSRSLTLRYLRNALGDSDEASTVSSSFPEGYHIHTKILRIIKKAIESLEFVRGLPSDTRALVLNSFIGAIKTTFMVSAAAMVVGLITTSLMNTSFEEPLPEAEGEAVESDS